MSFAPCPACHEPVGGPICVSCGLLQSPPASLDPWAALGLPRRWAHSPAELDQAWKARSKLVHPDRFVGQAPAIRRSALAWTAAINEARRALKTTSGRALWLSIGRPDLPERDGPALSPDFLEWVFEQQVALSEAPEAVHAEVEAAHDGVMASLDAAFAEAEAGGAPPDTAAAALARVPELVARLRYIDQLKARLAATR